MPHTKPITVGIIYRPPNQTKFLDIFEENLPNLNTSYREIYFLGDININIFEKWKYDFDKSSSNNKNLDSLTKNSHEYCTLFGLKQLIKCPTRAKCNNSSILDHVPASFPVGFSQDGVIDAWTAINKVFSVFLKIIHLRLTKRLKKIKFSQLWFDDINKAYANFIQKVMVIIDNQ